MADVLMYSREGRCEYNGPKENAGQALCAQPSSQGLK
jgi:hypothetical protein